MRNLTLSLKKLDIVELYGAWICAGFSPVIRLGVTCSVKSHNSILPHVRSGKQYSIIRSIIRLDRLGRVSKIGEQQT
jgi:hypothetical protein